MSEFYQNNTVTIWVIAFVAEVLLGLLAQGIAERKGHPKGWFWAGFFLSIIGVIWTTGLPDEKLRKQIKQMGGSPSSTTFQPQPAAPPADDTELIAVLSAAIAAFGSQQGKQYILRSFRPVGAGSTAWSRLTR